MKLVAQIAAGILLAGFVSWIFWMTVFVGVAKNIPNTTAGVSHVIRTNGPFGNPNIARPLPREERREAPQPAKCVNFVQTAKGERHCLENQHDVVATLPATNVRAVR